MKLRMVILGISLFCVDVISTLQAAPLGFTPITKASDFDPIMQKTDYAIVKFTWNRCAPCKRMEPIDQEIAALYQKPVPLKRGIKGLFSNIFNFFTKKPVAPVFYSVEVEELEELMKPFGINGVPTYLFMKKRKRSFPLCRRCEQRGI